MELFPLKFELRKSNEKDFPEIAQKTLPGQNPTKKVFRRLRKRVNPHVTKQSSGLLFLISYIYIYTRMRMERDKTLSILPD